MVDASAGGCLLNRQVDEASRILEEMAANSYQWPTERTPVFKAAAVESDSKYDDLMKKFTLLKSQIETENVSHINQRNHPNFQQPPAGFTVQNGVIQEPKKPNLEELMQQLVVSNQQMTTN